MGLSIGKVARAAGMSVDTVRFYEREGLIPPVRRTESGYRDYAPETIHRLRFIRRAKETGFSLGEIRELLELRTEEGSPCHSVLHLAQEKLALVRDKIRDLRRMEAALDSLVADCLSPDHGESCPVLERLNWEEDHLPDR
ncbi:MAG: heavy metal-responsive transcriptional regulator [Leptospirillia bacterium]